MMENVKWLIQKKGVFIIELLVIVIACVIVLKGPKQNNSGKENIEEIRAQKAEVPVNHMEGIDADEIDGDEIEMQNLLIPRRQLPRRGKSAFLQRKKRRRFRRRL